jgi:hypothetical protein
VAVVHSIDKHIVYFPAEQFRQIFCSGQQRGNHGEIPDAVTVQLAQSIDSGLDGRGVRLEELPHLIIGGGHNINFYLT